jgi:hypothetical protein
MRTIIRRLVVSAVAACLGAAVPAHAQPADARALSGRWTGTYECLQGITALELELRGNGYGIVQGTFAFSPTAENREVETGRYPVMGRFTGTSLVLRPIDVRDMPGVYVPVGIQATVTGRRMTGWIEGPGCGALTLARAESAAPSAPLPGGYGQQRWDVIGEAELGRLSVDGRDDRSRGASVTRTWMRWETLRDDAAAGVQAGARVEWEVEVDCAARLVRVWHTVQYGPDGQVTVFEASAPYAWEPITDDSMYDRVAERACRRPAPRKG